MSFFIFGSILSLTHQVQEVDMSLYRIVLFLIFHFVSYSATMAQTLHGVVLADRKWNLPVPRALVRNMCTQQAVLANQEGHFSIAANSGDTLLITAPLFNAQEYPLKGSSFRGIHVFYLTAQLYRLPQVDVKAQKYSSVFLDSAALQALIQQSIRSNETFIEGLKMPRNKVQPTDKGSLLNADYTIISFSPTQVVKRFFRRDKQKNETGSGQDVLVADSSLLYERVTKAQFMRLSAFKGDSLQLFIHQFRLPADSFYRMSDFELYQLIQQRAKDFRQRGMR